LIHVKEAVIVEGKYDKIKLSSLIDGLILPTNGFRIFKDPEKMALIRSLADTRGLLILTDSDSAGFLIRNYLSGCIAPEKIRHAYIPDILGKEKRKDKPSKEGKLGVEGVPISILKEALLRAGVSVDEKTPQQSRRIRNYKKVADLC
jgi:ribonuclease M5